MGENRELSRRQTRSAEGLFLYEMQHKYELSLKISEQILLTAKEILERKHTLSEGEMDVVLIGIEERSSKLIESMYKRRICLTVDAGYKDIQTIKDYGRNIIAESYSTFMRTYPTGEVYIALN